MEQPVSAARDQAPGRGASAGHPRGFYTEPPALRNTIIIWWAEAENDHMPPRKGDGFSVWSRVPPGVICAPTKRGRCAAVLHGCRCCPPRPGGLAGAAVSRPRAHDMRPYESGPRCAAVLRGCRCCPPCPGGLAGAAMSRPRAHDMRPYERGPRCAAVLHGCRCCPPCPGGAVGAAISRPPGA